LSPIINTHIRFHVDTIFNFLHTLECSESGSLESHNTLKYFKLAKADQLRKSPNQKGNLSACISSPPTPNIVIPALYRHSAPINLVSLPLIGLAPQITVRIVKAT
jgi:hypothetical protein